MNKFDKNRPFFVNPKVPSNKYNQQPVYNKFDDIDGNANYLNTDENSYKIPLNKEYNLNLDVDYKKILNQSNIFRSQKRHKASLLVQGYDKYFF